MAIVAAMSGVPYALQDAKATGNGDVVCPPSSFRNHTITITGAAGVTAGAVQIETSDDPNYSGTWVAQGTPITVLVAQLDKELIGIFTAIRARISTTISGGGAPSVTVKYMGAKSY